MDEQTTPQIAAFDTDEYNGKPGLSVATRSNRRPETWIDDMVGALCDPIIVHQCPWGTRDMIPDWLFRQIKMDRLIELMLAQKEGRAPTGTDSEVLAYMIPRSMESPMGHDWTEIYLYVFNKTMATRLGKPVEIPEDIRKDEISDYQRRYLLDHLKHWIYTKKAQHRKHRTKQEKSEEKEAARIELEETPDPQGRLFEM